MARNWAVRLGALALLLVAFSSRGLAQASAGYAKIASTSGLSEIDTAVVDGDVYQYQVTAVNAAGESAPATSAPAVIPATGTHSVTIAWTASTTSGVTYNVYRIQVVPPNAVGAVTTTVN